MAEKDSFDSVIGRLKPEHSQILAECSRRMEELAATPRPPAWQTWLIAELDEELEHGPAYGCGTWFGDVAEFERVRMRRAMDDLAKWNLLVMWKRHGRRLSHVKLTEHGLRLAQQIGQESRGQRQVAAAAGS